MTGPVYADDQILLPNTPAQAKSLLHSLQQATGGTDLYVNANKIEFMCFNQKGAISTQSGKSLKLEDQFTQLGCNILSTENDVNIRLVKA